jgi:hypothetical protein
VLVEMNSQQKTMLFRHGPKLFKVVLTMNQGCYRGKWNVVG